MCRCTSTWSTCSSRCCAVRRMLTQSSTPLRTTRRGMAQMWRHAARDIGGRDIGGRDMSDQCMGAAGLALAPLGLGTPRSLAFCAPSLGAARSWAYLASTARRQRPCFVTCRVHYESTERWPITIPGRTRVYRLGHERLATPTRVLDVGVVEHKLGRQLVLLPVHLGADDTE